MQLAHERERIRVPTLERESLGSPCTGVGGGAHTTGNAGEPQVTVNVGFVLIQDGLRII